MSKHPMTAAEEEYIVLLIRKLEEWYATLTIEEKRHYRGLPEAECGPAVRKACEVYFERKLSGN